MQRVGIREVAKECGVSIATVSRALNGHPKVPPIRRRTVLAAAHKLGYKPNPMVSALMVARRNRTGTAHQTLAIVDFHHPFSSGESGRAAAQEATEAGWSVDTFRAARTGMPLSRIGDIFRARGIRAVVFGPTREIPDGSGFDWAAFSICTLGAVWSETRLHTVAPDYAQGMAEAVKELAARGFRRPGLAISQEALDIGGRRLLAGYLDAAALTGIPPLEPLIAPQSDHQAFLAWEARWVPDSLITDAPAMALERRKALPRIALGKPPSENVPYLDEKASSLGVIAAEIAMAGAYRHQVGVPATKRTVLIEMRLVHADRLGHAHRVAPPA